MCKQLHHNNECEMRFFHRHFMCVCVLIWSSFLSSGTWYFAFNLHCNFRIRKGPIHHYFRRRTVVMVAYFLVYFLFKNEWILMAQTFLAQSFWCHRWKMHFLNIVNFNGFSMKLSVFFNHFLHLNFSKIRKKFFSLVDSSKFVYFH